MENKFILDACCSVRAMWDKKNKNHPNATYIDIRKEPKGFIKEKPNYEINPDFVMENVGIICLKLKKEIKED